MVERRERCGGNRVQKRARGEGVPARRLWSLSFESLEDRVLLATLQVGGQIGEETVLEGILGNPAEPPNYLPAVSTPQSQQFPHSDGYASSNVTLTTGPSKLADGGVNLGFFDQGSVATTGLSSVYTSMGTSGSSGGTGDQVPVTIVAGPSDKNERPRRDQYQFQLRTRGVRLIAREPLYGCSERHWQRQLYAFIFLCRYDNDIDQHRRDAGPRNR